MALKLKQTALEWFNPEGYNLIGTINAFDNISVPNPIYISIAIRDNYDIILYHDNYSTQIPSGHMLGNLITIMGLDSGYFSNLKIRRGFYYQYAYLIVEYNNPQGQYEYKMLCFAITQGGGIEPKFFNIHTSNTKSNIAEILFNRNYVGFLFDLNTIYTYKNLERFEQADNTNFNNVIENINTFIFEDIPGELSVICSGFNYDNENISFGEFSCSGSAWDFKPALTVPIAQGQYFIQNKSSFIFAGTNGLFYFLNYNNNTLSLVSVDQQTFVILNISSIECNTPINNVYSTYVVNLEENTGLISLISNQSFTNLIQVVNEIQTFTATFKNYDNTLLYETQVKAGETPTYTGSTPTKPSDDLFDFIFTGWNPELAPILQDTTYTAQFRTIRKQVQVTFENYDGTILEQKNIGKGTEPTYTGETPTKPSDDLYDFTFSGWEPELGVIYEDTTYNAQFTAVRKQVHVIFKNYNETILEEKDIDKGTAPTYTGTTPTKPSDNLNDYTFSGWSPELGVINENTTYTAQYTAIRKQYKATFRNYDNTLLYETEVNAGETPSYVGPIPTREGDNLNDFVFSGWSPELAPILQDTTYIAQFRTVRKQVHVTFKNYDGTILEEKDIDKGTKPTYTGAKPSRPADPYYTYYFKGWEPELGIIMSDTIYTATYYQTAKSYQCKFVDYDGTVISQMYVNAGEYATPPEFKGTQSGYSFTGWNPDPLTTQILEPTTFNAVYVKGIAINLYKNTAENDRVDKTNYLNQVGTLYGVFKEETSVMNPEIIIEYGVIDFNYIYIPLLNRYYYINEIISVRNNLWKIRLNCDVLMSFKTEILNLECYVSRNEYTYNDYIEDNLLPLEYDKQVEEYVPTTPTNLEPYQFIDDYTIFITTVYSGNDNGFDYTDIVQGTVPFDIPNITPVSTYEQGSTAFKVAQYLPPDRGNIEESLSRFIDLIQGDNTVATYILSVIALPIKFPSVSNPFWSSITQRTNLLIGNDELSKIFNIPTNIGNTGAIPMFCNAKFTITGKYNNFLDYEPYTKYEIFLPYYGWLTLKSCDILNKNIYVAYIVQTDSSNGSVYVLTDDKVIFTSTCSIGVQFAISTTNRERINREQDANLLNMFVGTLVGGGTMLFGGIAGSPIGMGIGASKVMGSISSGISKSMTLMETASSKIGDGVSGAWSPKKVRVRITYPEIAVDDLKKYSKYIGRPLQENYTLNELNGYTIVGGVHVENIGLATEEEKTEIEKTLRSGFILPDKPST